MNTHWIPQLAAAALTLISAASAAVRPAAEKPNIVLIMADDVSWEAFGCYGAEDYRTRRPHTPAKGRL